MFLELPRLMLAEPSPAAVAAFDRYTRAVELRLAKEHRGPGLVAGEGDPARLARLRNGEVLVEKLTPSDGADFGGAMLHDWRGMAFVKGATAADFVRLMEDFGSYPQHFAPDIVRAKTVARDGERFQATMRIRQRHVITVVMDASFDVQFAQIDPRHGYQHLAEHAGSPKSKARGRRVSGRSDAGEEHDFPLSARYVLELRGAGRWTLYADRIGVADPVNSARSRLGAVGPYAGKHSARINGVHAAVGGAALRK